MIQCNPSELRSLVGSLMSCVSNLNGCASQVQGSLSAADSWRDGARHKVEEEVADCVARIRNIAQEIEEQICPQIVTRAQVYEELQRG